MRYLRDIYVTRKSAPVILMVQQGSNAIPMVFKYCDFEIPENSEARIYIRKPSKLEIYAQGNINDNSAIFDMTTQMTAEAGRSEGQIQIVKEQKILNSFLIYLEVSESIISGSAIESKDEFSILDTLINQARQEITNAQQATEAANVAAEIANTAASNADAKAQSAEDAASAANTAAADLQEMVDNGDFNSTITIGTVTTGEAGTQASVTNSGTAKDAVLDFVIPKGDTGSVENIEDTAVTFAEATTRENIAAGESLKTLFGKIKKWFSDLGTAAFRSVANNLTTSAAGSSVLDSYQGKVLADRVGTLSSLKTTAKSNVVAAVNELQTNFAAGNLAGFRMENHMITLSYYSASSLIGTYTAGANILGATVTIAQRVGTPCDQVVNTSINISGKQITVYARGNGFVSGHVLAVYLIIATEPK